MEATSKENLYVELAERYSIGRTAILKRMGKLKINAHKANGKAYITDAELNLLDGLHQWLENKEGTIQEFIQANLTEITTVEDSLTPSQQVELEAEPVNIYTADGSVNQMAQLINIAQQRAGGILIAERALTAQYLANPELLNEELKNQISFWEEKCVPAKINAEEFAKQLLSEFGD